MSLSSPAARRTPLAGLWPFLARYRMRLFLALLALVLAASATLVLPLAVRQMIDRGFSRTGAGPQEYHFLGLLAVAAALAFFTAARYYLVTWLGERVTADLRSAVYARVLSLSPEFFETTRVGEVLSRLTADTTLIQTVVGSSLSLALRNLVLLAGALFMLAVTSPRLTGITLALLLGVVVPIVLLGRGVRRLSRASQDRVAEASAIAGEILAAMTTVQAFTREDEERTRFAAATESAFATALRRVRVRALLTAVVILLVFGAIVLVLWLGARGVAEGSLSAGELAQFLLYAVVAAGSIGTLAEVYGEVQRAAGAAERLLELLAARPAIRAPESPVALPPLRGAVRFEGVGFHYPSRPLHPSLSGIELAVEPGETVALVGPTGAGKSTLFQLLLRFYDPQQGRIRLDGIDIAAVDPRAVRRAIGIVPQDTVIFSADALENIRYGRIEASDGEVRTAARLALAEEFIERLPEGYRTFLGERGTRLSGGQRQRIAIARAILKNPPVLLLDEATSALDAESERLVQEALEQLMRGRTCLVIAHRLATVKKADRIVVLDGGRIVDAGRHDELVRRGGLYARLAELQFGRLPQAAGP